MKRFISMLFIFLFLVLNMNTMVTFAQNPVSLTQGFYKSKDTGLVPNVYYKVKNSSPSNRVLIEVFDEMEEMQQFIRVEPNSSEYYLKPLGYDSIIVIIGKGTLVFS